MARILVGWELGAGLGHVTRLTAVARALSERGHRPFLVLRNLVDTWPVYSGERFPVFQAPIWQQLPMTSRKPFHAAGRSDIFAKQGFTDHDELQPMVHAWHRLIAFVRPAAPTNSVGVALCGGALHLHHSRTRPLPGVSPRADGGPVPTPAGAIPRQSGLDHQPLLA